MQRKLDNMPASDDIRARPTGSNTLIPLLSMQRLLLALESTDKLIMRLTSTASLGAALRNNVGRKHNNLHVTSSTYGVRSLTSGTYRVPKAFNEPNVCLSDKILSKDV
jgi:hypothetical protein